LDRFNEFHKVIGTYSSKIAANISSNIRRDVVRRGVHFVVGYYGILTSSVEVEAVVDMILVVPKGETLQATTGIGTSMRPYRWLTKVVAQHWKKLPYYTEMLDTVYPVNTVIESCVFGNFSFLPSVLEHNKF
jgi:hypothetical protein